ncbi:hypothetical protein Anapl_10642 [Anas platyrhynchos]|uniref:Uncharacterized protein n=1 Tax=Anas platyrhynchos TaxID=8839 RepID=R0K3Y2_ANAPL|nr:hypothetical protein Anapl_10642 [Anas platyrhynchos]
MHPWFVKEAFSPQAPSQLAKEVSATDLTSYLWDPAPVLGLCQDFPRDLDEAVMQDSTELPKKDLFTPKSGKARRYKAGNRRLNQRAAQGDLHEADLVLSSAEGKDEDGAAGTSMSPSSERQCGTVPPPWHTPKLLLCISLQSTQIQPPVLPQFFLLLPLASLHFSGDLAFPPCRTALEGAVCITS